MKEKTRKDLCEILGTFMDDLAYPDFLEVAKRVESSPDEFWHAIASMDLVMDLAKKLNCQWVKH